MITVMKIKSASCVTLFSHTIAFLFYWLVESPEDETFYNRQVKSD